MQTEETASTREATKRGVKTIVSTYAKADLDEITTSKLQLDKYQQKSY